MDERYGVDEVNGQLERLGLKGHKLYVESIFSIAVWRG
jgi:predicted RNA-binding protein